MAFHPAVTRTQLNADAFITTRKEQERKVDESCMYVNYFQVSFFLISTEAIEKDGKANAQLGHVPVGSKSNTGKAMDQVKMEPKEEEVSLDESGMSAYYSDDNSDDDFQPNKRKKVCGTIIFCCPSHLLIDC